MKKTEKQIYDFVASKKQQTKCKIVDDWLNEELYRAKIEAYEEVLNFIGTIRTKGE